MIGFSTRRKFDVLLSLRNGLIWLKSTPGAGIWWKYVSGSLLQRLSEMRPWILVLVGGGGGREHLAVHWQQSKFQLCAICFMCWMADSNHEPKSLRGISVTRCCVKLANYVAMTGFGHWPYRITHPAQQQADSGQELFFIWLQFTWHTRIYKYLSQQWISEALSWTR